MASWIIQYASFGVLGLTSRSPGVLDRADVPSVGHPDDNRHADATLVPVGHLGQLGGDLVEAGEDEPVELDLTHRPKPAHRQTDRGADDSGLRQGGVDNPPRPELLLQPFGDAEHAAERSNVLAHEQHALVVAHLTAQAVGDALEVRHGCRVSACGHRDR